jgi:hypothetical protein
MLTQYKWIEEKKMGTFLLLSLSVQSPLNSGFDTGEDN